MRPLPRSTALMYCADRQYNVPLLINDRIDVHLAIGGYTLLQVLKGIRIAVVDPTQALPGSTLVRQIPLYLWLGSC